MIVGEAFGYDEARIGKPFVGASGQELTRMLAEAGIDRSQCFLTNVVPAQPQANKMWRFFRPRDEARKSSLPTTWGLHPTEIANHGLKKLAAQVDHLNPDLIIACGNYAFWAFSDDVRISYHSKDSEGFPMDGGGRMVPAGINSFRGSMLRSRSGHRLLPILHPAAILRAWDQRAFTVGDLRNRVPMALAGNWENPKPAKLLFRPSFSEAIAYLYNLEQQLKRGLRIECSIDLETTPLNLVTCISFCTNESLALTIPFFDKDASGFRSYWPIREEVAFHRLIRRICRYPNFLAIGQNFCYDQTYFHDMFGVVPRLAFDTMLGQNFLFPGTKKDLGFLSSLYCTYHRYWKDDNQEWDTKSNIDDHLLYNAEDTIRTLEIAGVMRKMLAATKREHLYADRLRVADLALRMSLRGLKVDKKRRAELFRDLATAQEVRRTLLFTFIPQSWVDPKAKVPWFQSPAQTKTVLYEILQMKEQRQRKTKTISTDDASLTTLIHQYPEFKALLQIILDLRSIGVYINTFLTSALEPNDRMCTSLDPAGTETFRFASRTTPLRRGMNMQNIPGD
jgi:uracil-DNA glycosylase